MNLAISDYETGRAAAFGPEILTTYRVLVVQSSDDDCRGVAKVLSKVKISLWQTPDRRVTIKY